MTMRRPSMMLKVNNTSSRKGGSGTTNSASMSSTSVGAPTLFKLSHVRRPEASSGSKDFDEVLLSRML